MAMQMNAVLLKGDHLEALETKGLGWLGYSRPEMLVDNVPGALVARTSADLLARQASAVEVVGLTVHDGWTLVVDPSGFIVEDLEGWLALSGELSTRVICLRHDEFGTELGVFDEGRMRRIISHEEGEGSTYLGEPLAVEEWWQARLPSLEELVQSVACLSIDLERVNVAVLFRLLQLRHDPQARAACLSDPAPRASSELPDNVVPLVLAAS
jgi:hypothetical protein